MKAWACSLDCVTPFLQFPRESSFAMSHTIALEVGGPNDNLAKHIFDSTTGKTLARDSLRVELIESEKVFGVRIFSTSSSLIEIRHRGLMRLCKVSPSDIIIFPTEIATNLSAEGIEPVLIKEWLIGAIFADFNPHVSDYRSQMSELKNNDAFLYSKLVSEKKMVFQSLHDVIEHATGASGTGWNQAQITAKKVYFSLVQYFGSQGRGSIPSHILPFVIGVLVDDLTQSPFYGAAGRVAVIEELLEQLQRLRIKAHSPHILTEFPTSIESVLIMARKPKIEMEKDLISKTVSKLVEDLYSFTRI